MADSFQPKFADLVRNYSTSEGTGNLVLGPPVTGYRSFADVMQPGDSFYYSVMGVEIPDESEVGRGTMEADGSISRDPIGGPPRNFTGGTKTVALVAAAEWYEGVQAGSASAFASAESRAALAAKNDSSKPAVLHEAGREGLFVFDPSNLSAQVAADPAQGIHVAPATDPSGASGAWTRRYTGAVEAKWFGALGDGDANDTAAIQSAINYVESAGGGELRLGHGTFSVVGPLMMLAPDVILDARGATITSADSASMPTLYVGGDRTKIMGGTWKLTSGATPPRQFDVEGRDCEIDGAYLLKDPEAPGYQAYVRDLAEGFVMRNCRTEGSNGIYCEASNSAFLLNRFKGRAQGGDDALAIKGIQGTTTGIRIIGNEFENLAFFCSIGSEIGVLDANDPTYSRAVRDVVVTANRGLACSGIAFIKPGAISNYDYRDGTVENVVISDNVLSDPTGLKFSRGIAITPARGARVRRVTGSNNLIVARAKTTTGRLVGALDCYIPDYGGVGTAETEIRDIDLEIKFVDPFGGVAAGGSAPGDPVQNIAAFEVATAGRGTMRDVRVSIEGDGCSSSGVFVDANVPKDAIEISRLNLSNINAGSGAGGAGVKALSGIVINDPAAKIEPAFGPAYRLEANGEITASVSNAFFCEQITAGNTGSRRPWAAPVRCYVTKVELLSDVNIPQSNDDSNYTQFELRVAGAGSFFRAVKSSATGGQAFPANTFNELMLARDITNATQQADCFFARDSMLQLAKRDFGTGNTVRNAYLRIHWAPY